MGSRAGWFRAMGAIAAVSIVHGGSLSPLGRAQAQDGGTITLRSDVQEANAATGIITARGNVQIDYPARRIQATSAQADFFSNEQRIVLSGSVVVTQEGNTLRAETVTYLIEEDRFVATPRPNDQVEAVYTLPAPAPAAPQTSSPGQPPSRPPAVLDVSPIDGGGNPGAAPSTPLDN